MKHWRTIVSQDNPNLHHWDIMEHSPVEVTVESWHKRTIRNEDGDEDTMLFIKFKGAKKPLGLNVTNCLIIEAIAGSPEPEKWIGKKLTLRTANCRGKDCIRVEGPKGLRMPKNCPKFTYTDKPRTSGEAASLPVEAEPVTADGAETDYNEIM